MSWILLKSEIVSCLSKVITFESYSERNYFARRENYSIGVSVKTLKPYSIELEPQLSYRVDLTVFCLFSLLYPRKMLKLDGQWANLICKTLKLLNIENTCQYSISPSSFNLIRKLSYGNTGTRASMNQSGWNATTIVTDCTDFALIAPTQDKIPLNN